MDISQVKCLKELEEENRRLKQMYADLALGNKMLKDVIEKNSRVRSKKRNYRRIGQYPIFCVNSGCVIAADLQEGMLNKVKAKINGTALEQNIRLHKCEPESIGLNEKVDFILAFFMVHEVPDHDKLFAEVKTLLKSGGRMLIIEPNFHVSKKSFNAMMDIIRSHDLIEIDRPKHFLCRSVLIENR